MKKYTLAFEILLAATIAAFFMIFCFTGAYSTCPGYSKVIMHNLIIALDIDMSFFLIALIAVLSNSKNLS